MNRIAPTSNVKFAQVSQKPRLSSVLIMDLKQRPQTRGATGT